MAAKSGHDDDLTENHEINVTPFIDVMLVLLIIFMVAAPLATVDVKVDLPASTAVPGPRPDKPIYLSISADRTLSLGNAPVTHATLKTALTKETGGDLEQRIFLRADKSVEYDTLMQAINALRGAGYLKVALVGEEGAVGGS
ncbi:MAG TPA: TonB system transport protein ExbD [Sphingobium sp.]|nr:TonB system transport protein ExbD [Sphingobium sp.]